MKFIGIIPARWASTRFPGKPLAQLGGMPVIERVWRRVSEVLDHVVVATDSERICETVSSFGGTAIMTSSSHRTGTDRCLEAYKTLMARCAEHGGACDLLTDKDHVVINIQGDEPFIDPEQIRGVMRCFDNPDTDIATLVRPFDRGGRYEDLCNPNRAKVVVGVDGRALYFSRSVIPNVRGVDTAEWPSRAPYNIHVGLYAYRAQVLEQITALPQSPLELAESLEQLRWLENGFVIRTAPTSIETIGIDTPDDLAAAEAHLQQLSR